MNYGKRNTRKREAELTSKTVMIRKKINVIFCKALLICCFAVVIIGGCTAFGVAKGILDSAPTIQNIDATPTGYLTTVLDSQGNDIATLVSSGSNRRYVTIDEIPLNLQHAFVAIEDERFYEHNGIDLQGIARAAMIAIQTRDLSQGASTITQQLLKNTVFTEWTSESSNAEKIQRKVQEQYLAIQLEKVVDKDWILENYLNAINLGQNTLGVGVASERYFGKEVSELTLSECAVLAAITQNPSYYNPISNPEGNAERREKVLRKMRDQGYITQDDYDEAMADDVYSRIQLVNVDSGSDEVNSYFVDELTNQIITDLIEQKGYTETQAYKALYQGGLTIYSTQDPTIQQICDEEINNLDNYPAAPKISFSYRVSIQSADGTIANYSEQTMRYFYNKSINYSSEENAAAAIEQYKADIMKEGDVVVDGSETITYTLQPQAALTVMNQENGDVVALVGGRGEKTASKTLNRATDTPRQPGSTFKIIACYAAALDAGGLTLADVQDDAPYQYTTGDKKFVSNYDSRYRGFTTLREAITYSINIVTVKTLTQITPTLGYQYVQNFGITTVPEEDANQALALGGISQGVTNLELTAAYATIANEGTYIKPRFYTTVLDHDGNVLLDNTTPEEHTVLKETTAWLLTNAMEDVLTAGTGKIAYFGSSMAQAGKSGTTNGNRDCLFAGYTPYYTCVVWGGFDDNATQSSSQTTYPKYIWKAVMKRIHEDLPYEDFTKPDGIVTAQVCKESGKLAIAGVCSNDPRGNCVITEYFAAGTVPTEYCDHHTSGTICADSGMLAGPYCVNLATRVYVIGGSSSSEDAPYMMPGETCNLHLTADSVVVPAVPGVDGTDPNVVPDPNAAPATPPPAETTTTTTSPDGSVTTTTTSSSTTTTSP